MKCDNSLWKCCSGCPFSPDRFPTGLISSQYLSLYYCSRILIGVAYTNFYSFQPSLLLTVNDISVIQNWQFHSCIKIICVGHTRYWKNASFLFWLKNSFIICLQCTYTHIHFFAFHVSSLTTELHSRTLGSDALVLWETVTSLLEMSYFLSLHSVPLFLWKILLIP